MSSRYRLSKTDEVTKPGNRRKTQHVEVAKPKIDKTLPKKLRYDLESALIGLCDVWFDEIKPYLTQNNIKMHIPPKGSGDHDDPNTPLGSCTHCDPGAAFDNHLNNTVNCANSCGMRRRASKALQGKPTSLYLPHQVVPTTQSHSIIRSKYQKSCAQSDKPRKCRLPNNSKSCKSQSLVKPRRCRTYSLLPSVQAQPKKTRKSKRTLNTNSKQNLNRRSVSTSNKGTQTPFPHKFTLMENTKSNSRNNPTSSDRKENIQMNKGRGLEKRHGDKSLVSLFKSPRANRNDASSTNVFAIMMMDSDRTSRTDSKPSWRY